MDEHEPDERDDLEDGGDETQDLSESARRARLRRIAAEAREAMEVINHPEPDEEETPTTDMLSAYYGHSMAEVIAPLSNYNLGIDEYTYGNFLKNITPTRGLSEVFAPSLSTLNVVNGLGVLSAQVAKMPPVSIDGITAAITKLQDLIAPLSFANAEGDTKPLLGNLAAQSVINTKSRFASEGFITAMHQVIADYSYMRHELNYFTETVDEDAAPLTALDRMVKEAKERRLPSDEDLQDLQRLTDELDADAVSALTQYALEDADFEHRESFYQRLEEAAPRDLDEFERIARDILEEEGLQDAGETEDEEASDLSPRQALVALAVAQFPDITIREEHHRRIKAYATGSGVLLYGYLRTFQPHFYLFLAALLEMLGLVTALNASTDRVLKHVTEEDDTQDEND